LVHLNNQCLHPSKGVRFKAIADEVGDVLLHELDHRLLLPPHQIQPGPGALDCVLAFVVELGVEQAVEHLRSLVLLLLLLLSPVLLSPPLSSPPLSALTSGRGGDGRQRKAKA
jgi:hypothetical protein